MRLRIQSAKPSHAQAPLQNTRLHLIARSELGDMDIPIRLALVTPCGSAIC